MVLDSDSGWVRCAYTYLVLYSICGSPRPLKGVQQTPQTCWDRRHKRGVQHAVLQGFVGCRAGDVQGVWESLATCVGITVSTCIYRCIAMRGPAALTLAERLCGCVCMLSGVIMWGSGIQYHGRSAACMVGQVRVHLAHRRLSRREEGGRGR